MPKIVLALALGVAFAQLGNLATTIYLHRSLSHRALVMRPALAMVFRCGIWLTTGIKPREWVAVHRKHHAFTDEPSDPHSPIHHGWLRVQLTNAALYRRVARAKGTVERYARDLPPDRWDRVLFDRAFIGLGIGITTLIVLLGPVYGVLAAVIHMVVYLAIGGAVNGIGHHFGKRPYANSATNLLWLALLSGGEGFHNNHHAAPTSARLGWKRGQIDFGWWCIAAFKRFGWATIRLEEPKLTAAASR